MTASDQRRLLGDFVRAHREKLPPEGGAVRRRTPGLRREELAARAGISATWCTWIEQGRVQEYHMVARQFSDHWIEASKVPALRPLFEQRRRDQGHDRT